MNNSAKLMALVVTVIVVLCAISVVSDTSEADTTTVNLGPGDSLDSAITNSSYNSSSDVVLVLSEGTYNYTTTSSTAFHGRSLTILAAEGASVKIELDGSADGAENIAALSTATNGVETSLYVEGVTFTAPSGEPGQLRKWTFDNVTFKDCRFENTSLDTITGGFSDHSYEGTFSIVGCVFETSVGTHPSNPFAVHVMANDVLIRNTTVSGYERGINIGVHGEDTGSVMVTGCTIQNLIGTNSKHIALQVGDSIGDAIIAVTDNEISAQYGLSIHDGATIGEHAAVNVIGNTFTDCDADVFYAGEVTHNYGIAINLLDNSFVHGGASSDSPTLGNESETPVPEDDVAITDLSEDMSWYTPGAEMTISDESQLREFAALVNFGIDFYGETVRLGGSITLNGEWTPIGTGTANAVAYAGPSATTGYIGTPFRGTFDGSGNTIAGLTITSGSTEDILGLFGVVDGGTVSGLTLESVSIDVGEVASVGAVVGHLTNGTVSQCTVSGSVVVDASDGVYYHGVGGVVGFVMLNGTVSECTNNATIGESTPDNTSNPTIENIGGVVGSAYYSETGSRIDITDCHNTGDVTGTKNVGGIVGMSSAFVSKCTNSGDIRIVEDGETADNNSVGGIVGEQRDYGSVSDCINSGTVTNNGNDYATGGIVGWVRYWPASMGNESHGLECNVKATISVIGCINESTGTVSSKSTHDGGIIGAVYHSVIVDDCRNEASVTGTNFVGGIIGGIQTVHQYHPGDGCRLVLTNCTNNGKLTATDKPPTNFGSIVGQCLLSESVTAQNCPEPPNGSRWTILNNVDTANGDLQTGYEGYEPLLSVVIDGETVCYLDLSTAIANCPEDCTITLLGNIELSSGVTIPDNKDITFSMGSFSITGNGCDAPLITNNGTLRISDGTIRNVTDDDTAADPGMAILNNGTLLIDGGSFESGNANCICNYGEAVINGGSFTNTGNPCIRNYGNMEIHGGTFHNSSCAYEVYGYTVSSNNATDDGSAPSPTLIIDESVGEVVVTGTRGALGVSDGYAEVRGGSFTVQQNNCGNPSHTTTHYAIYCAGERGSVDMRVYGGEFTSYNNVCVQVGNSADGGRELPAALSIYGGTFNVSKNDTVDIVRNDTNTQNVPSVEIYGGRFLRTVDPDFLASGYVQDSEGNIVVGSVGEMEAIVDGVYYRTVGEAIVAARDGDTVKLQRNVVSSITIDGLNVTLDLNGHTIRNVASAESGSSVSGDHTTIVKAGATLTLIDSVGTGVVDNVSNGKAALYNEGTVIMKGGTLTRTVDTTGCTWYTLYNDGTMTIDGGTVRSDGDQSSLIVNGLGKTATMTVNDGTFYKRAFNCFKNEEHGTVTVNRGTFEGVGFAFQNWNVATINDGVFNNIVSSVTYGSIPSSKLTINGGTFNGDVTSWNMTYGGSEAANPPEVTIVNGTFHGRIIMLEGAEGLATPTSNASKASASVRGGTFGHPLETHVIASGLVLVSNPDGTYGVAPEGETVTVTFVIGEDEVAVTVLMGSTVPAGMIPDLPEAPEHYGYSWDVPTDSPFYEDATITAGLMITDVGVSVDIDGDTAVAVIETPVEYVDAIYLWFSGIDGDDPDQIGSAEAVVLDEDGRYGLAIIIMDANGVFGMATCEFDYVAESDLPPFIPFPDDDDVYVPIPPSVVVQQDSSDDDTTTIAACAAAAVAAAILAILLASLYRRK